MNKRKSIIPPQVEPLNLQALTQQFRIVLNHNHPEIQKQTKIKQQHKMYHQHSFSDRQMKKLNEEFRKNQYQNSSDLKQNFTARTIIRDLQTISQCNGSNLAQSNSKRNKTQRKNNPEIMILQSQCGQNLIVNRGADYYIEQINYLKLTMSQLQQKNRRLEQTVINLQTEAGRLNQKISYYIRTYSNCIKQKQENSNKFKQQLMINLQLENFLLNQKNTTSFGTQKMKKKIAALEKALRDQKKTHQLEKNKLNKQIEQSHIAFDQRTDKLLRIIRKKQNQLKSKSKFPPRTRRNLDESASMFSQQLEQCQFNVSQFDIHQLQAMVDSIDLDDHPHEKHFLSTKNSLYEEITKDEAQRDRRTQFVDEIKQFNAETKRKSQKVNIDSQDAKKELTFLKGYNSKLKKILNLTEQTFQNMKKYKQIIQFTTNREI